MGVRGLWELLKVAKERSNIRSLMLRDGFEGRPQYRGLRLGIDVSIWFYQLGQTFAIGHAQAGENPELRTLFFRLVRLLQLPVHPVFVFDGPSRPTSKRGKRVIAADHWLALGMQRFIEAFGFQWHQVCTGEAEAELAHMNKLNLIDAVLTNDGDSLLFRAQVIIRNANVKEGADVAEVYRSSRVVHDAKLTRGDMILIALLSGCDYDEAGLRGYGSHIARGLVRYGLGRVLYRAACAYDDAAMTTFLADWRETFKAKLRDDPNNFIGRRYPALADALPDSFPNIATLEAYVRPVVSPLQHGMMLVMPGRINPAQLGVLCELYFAWGTRPQILQRFRDLLWVGVAVRTLIAEVLFREGVLRIYCRIKVTSHGFNEAVQTSLLDLRPYNSHGNASASGAELMASASHALMTRVPQVILERARPDFLGDDNTLVQDVTDVRLQLHRHKHVSTALDRYLTVPSASSPKAVTTIASNDNGGSMAVASSSRGVDSTAVTRNTSNQLVRAAAQVTDCDIAPTAPEIIDLTMDDVEIIDLTGDDDDSIAVDVDEAEVADPL
ncbi:Flap endonuclease GEN 1 [Grifola frondosa]|uniref:Flap endonuclease GEN 1 n=1 Tax=Grifola frondosa TaxID=5627 RepID=A0A1C7M2G0_GRIFR|nr:Flap endonuclease GEN 1 [Grifola frondosa]